MARRKTSRAKRSKHRSFGAISIKARCPREGTRVTFEPGHVSRALYSYPVPRVGEVGDVVSIPLGRGKATCLRGPGGGLIYVRWRSVGVAGVSSMDLDKA